MSSKPVMAISNKFTVKEVNKEIPHIKVTILFFIVHLLKIVGMKRSVCILV